MSSAPRPDRLPHAGWSAPPGSAPAAGRAAPFAEYANAFRIGQNADEFVIEFGQAYTGDAAPQVLYRVVLSPSRARELAALLTESVAAHEADRLDAEALTVGASLAGRGPAERARPLSRPPGEPEGAP